MCIGTRVPGVKVTWLFSKDETCSNYHLPRSLRNWATRFNLPYANYIMEKIEWLPGSVNKFQIYLTIQKFELNF